MNRRTLFLLSLLVAVLVALTAFYLYLTGGDSNDRETGTSSTSNGLIHVRSVYTADGENLRRPTGLGVGQNGDFYVTLKDDSRIIGLDREGDFKVKWGENGLKQGQLLAPTGVAVDALGNQVYVIDRARLRIVAYDTSGRYQWEKALLNPVGITVVEDGVLVTSFGPLYWLTSEGEQIAEIGGRGFAPGLFDYARSAALLPDGDVVVADTNNARVQRIELTSEMTTTVRWIAGTPPTRQDDPKTLFGVPAGVAVDDEGRVYVLDGFRHKIDVLNPDTGKVLHSFAGLDGASDGRFQLPTGIGYLGGDTFVVTDTYNDRVQIFRLLLPEDDNLINRYRWLTLLPLLLLAPLALLFRRKRVFVTQEALVVAAEADRLRLLAGAFGRLHVLPEVEEAFRDYVEEGVALGGYLAPVGAAGSIDDAEERLATAAEPAGSRRWLFPRHSVVCADTEQCKRLASHRRLRARDWPSVREEFQIEGDKN